MKLHWIFLLIYWFLPISHPVASPPYEPNQVAERSRHSFSVYIMDQGRSTPQELAAMLLYYNPLIDISYANELALVYVEESTDEGVNHDIAFCQMILETGYLKFTGSVKKYQNNFCGLGATGGHKSGEFFPDVRTGVRAHIQHLKAYATSQSIIKPVVDNRMKYVKRGSAPTIYALKGKWASDVMYDKKIESLLTKLFAFRTLLAQQKAN